jgi:hypothetical protein
MTVALSYRCAAALLDGGTVAGFWKRSKSGGELSSATQLTLLLLALLPLAALPWTVEYWPAQDDPNHLAIAHVLQSIDDPGSPFARFLEADLTFRPYMLQYYVLLGLGRVMELTTAHRLLVSLFIFALPLAVLLALRRIVPERQANVFLVAPLPTGWLLLLGLLNFCAGLVLGLIAVALAWGRAGGQGETPDPPGPVAILGASVALFFAAAFHPLAAALTGVTLLVLEGAHLRRPATWARLAVVAGPAVGSIAISLVAYSGLESPTSLSVLGVGFLGLVPTLILLVKGQVGLSYWELPFRLPAVCLLLGGGLYAIRKHGVRGSGRDAALARLTLVLLALIFLLPRSFVVVGHVTDRVMLLCLVASALVASLPRMLRSPRRLAVLAFASCLGLATVQYFAAARESERIATIVAAGQVIPRGSRVLPLNFDPVGSSANASSGLHAWGHVVRERDVVTPYLFASGSRAPYGGAAVRPLRYREAFVEDSPFIHEGMPRVWGKVGDKLPELQRTHGTDLFLAVAEDYDRVLVVSPPTDFLAHASDRLEEEIRVGDVWVFRPVLPRDSGEDE